MEKPIDDELRWTDANFDSGIQQALRASMRRPAIRRSAFQPIKKNFTPALSTRFASTEAQKEGKIHQVIGAIVDSESDYDLVAAKNFSC